MSSTFEAEHGGIRRDSPNGVFSRWRPTRYFEPYPCLGLPRSIILSSGTVSQSLPVLTRF